LSEGADADSRTEEASEKKVQDTLEDGKTPVARDVGGAFGILALLADRSRRRMMASVPKASFVIANPTHYAIALRYVREEGGAPVVLAKGKDLVALRIREIAEKNGVPVLERKELARAMYGFVEVDRMIPQEFYRPIAELIHFLETLPRRRH
jgi:flagellar biosynthesis protein FlhB